MVNDYRRDNYEPYAWRTRDFGATWQRIVDANDVISFTLSILQDPEEDNLLFLGTDDGLYVSIDGANTWTKWTNGVPTVPVADMVIHPREHDLVLGTFGRAAFVLDDIRPLRAMAAQRSVMDQPLALFAPPTAYIANRQEAPGTRFGGDALYNGENRPFGAIISYWVNKPGEKKEEVVEETGRRGRGRREAAEPASSEATTDAPAVKWDSVTLEIYDGERLIRTLKWAAPEEAGLHRTRWGMDEAGVSVPRRSGNRRRGGEPGGVQVLPGTYQLKIMYGDQEAAGEITVAVDPNLGWSQASLEAAYAAAKTVEGYSASAAKALEQLQASREVAEGYAKDLKEADADQYKEQIDQSKAMVDSIDALLDVYYGKEDDRQGITSSLEVTVNQRIRVADGYVGGRGGAPTATEERMMQQAEDALTAWLESVNGFYADQWPSYRSSVENISLSPFKDYEPVSIEE